MTWETFVALVAIPAIGIVGWVAWLAYAGLQQFRVEVAERYVSVAYLKDVETRLMASVEKLDAKLDRLLDRGGE